MKFLTKSLIKNLPPLYANEKKDPDQIPVIVKYFTPDAQATWYITEADLKNRIFFGWCDLGLGSPELGYVSIDELMNLRGPLGLPVERDMYFKGTLGQVMKGELR